MPVTIPRGRTDGIIDGFVEVLKAYEVDHPHSQIDIYRQNPASIRIRIVDSSFQGLEKSDRHTRVWKYLEKLSEDTQDDLSMLVLLTPAEVNRSFANMEFEDPVPSLS